MIIKLVGMQVVLCRKEATQKSQQTNSNDDTSDPLRAWLGGGRSVVLRFGVCGDSQQKNEETTPNKRIRGGKR